MLADGMLLTELQGPPTVGSVVQAGSDSSRVARTAAHVPPIDSRGAGYDCLRIALVIFAWCAKGHAPRPSSPANAYFALCHSCPATSPTWRGKRPATSPAPCALGTQLSSVSDRARAEARERVYVQGRPVPAQGTYSRLSQIVANRPSWCHQMYIDSSQPCTNQLTYT